MRPPEEQKVTITYVKDQAGKGSWKVDPPEVHAREGDTIRWKVTGEEETSDITLLFPQTIPFWHRDFEIARDQALVLKVGAGKKGKYPYAAFCHSANCFAEGKSNPIVIID